MNCSPSTAVVCVLTMNAFDLECLGEINGRLLDDTLDESLNLDALHSLGPDPPVQNAILTHPL